MLTVIYRFFKKRYQIAEVVYYCGYPVSNFANIAGILPYGCFSQSLKTVAHNCCLDSITLQKEPSYILIILTNNFEIKKRSLQRLC